MTARRTLAAQEQTRDFLRYARHYTFDQWTELWWAARGVSADDADTHAARLANPDDMAFKSAEYVQEYYAKKEPTP